MARSYLSELEGIRRKGGGYLSPQAVVDFAEDPSTALHGRFDWDNDVAGPKYRLWQARQLIRIVVNILPNSNSEPIKVRAYVSLRQDREEGLGYRLTTEVMEDDDTAAALLSELREEVELLCVKYGAYRSLNPVLESIRIATGLPPRGKKK